jgi:RNA polymerase sigma-70 factor (ECF subfamily)
MMKNQSHDRVRKMLELLPEDQREVIILRHYSELSFRKLHALTIAASTLPSVECGTA